MMTAMMEERVEKVRMKRKMMEATKRSLAQMERTKGMKRQRRKSLNCKKPSLRRK